LGCRRICRRGYALLLSKRLALLPLLLRKSLAAIREDPGAAFELADNAVRLTAHLGEFYDPQWVIGLRARALAVRANARRVLAELRSADADFRKALQKRLAPPPWSIPPGLRAPNPERLRTAGISWRPAHGQRRTRGIGGRLPEIQLIGLELSRNVWHFFRGTEPWWLGLKGLPITTFTCPPLPWASSRPGSRSLVNKDLEKASEIELWIDQVAQTWNVLPLDGQIFRVWAKLMHRRSDDLMADALIAATAMVHHLVVVTRNVRDFATLEVATLNPFEAA
jgi:predicted nucleic acid-binding protein